LAEFSYNTSVYKTTGKAPFYLLYGYLPEIDAGDDVLRRGAATATERIEAL
jgi:hypothetical protein